MEIHDAILEVSGGRPGVLDENVILGATQRPKTYLSYNENSDIHTVCAVLLDSIARNHGFVEGNKRSGLMTAILTYEINGISIQSGADRTSDFEDLVLWVVTKKPDVESIATKLRVLINIYGSKNPNTLALRLKKHLKPYRY